VAKVEITTQSARRRMHRVRGNEQARRSLKERGEGWGRGGALTPGSQTSKLEFGHESDSENDDVVADKEIILLTLVNGSCHTYI